MSTSMDVESVSKETPTEGVREDQEMPPADIGSVDDGSEEGEIPDDLPKGTKRQRSPSNEEQPDPKRIKPAPKVEAGLFKRMRQPGGIMPCMISVDHGNHIGGIYLQKQGFTITLYINPGPQGAPRLSLGFRKNGRTGRALALIEWDTEARFKGQWAMSHFVHGFASPDAKDPRMSDPAVLNDCKLEDMGELLYLRFVSWPQAGGYALRGVFDDQDTQIKRSMEIMTQPLQPYSLEIWFFPKFKAIDFRRQCLRYFSDSLEQRIQPLHFWTDPEANHFTDISVPPPIGSELDGKVGKTFFRLPTTQPASARQNTVTGGGESSRRAEQSTTKLPLAQQDEDAMQTVAQDAKILDRSSSPRTEEQAILTFRGGSTSPPAQEQPASVPRSPHESTVPVRGSSRIRGLMEGYMPADMVDTLGDSEGEDLKDILNEYGVEADSDGD